MYEFIDDWQVYDVYPEVVLTDGTLAVIPLRVFAADQAAVVRCLRIHACLKLIDCGVEDADKVLGLKM